MKSYGTTLRYECGIARKFYDEAFDEFYDERNMTCNWDKRWTLPDQLDPCVWVQCINPPSPPASSQLRLVWDGAPVNFTHNVSYVCQEEELYFEWDRDMLEYNVECLTDGIWAEPDEWPVCVESKVN